MTTDWTPRERQLRAALWEYRQCQRRMLDLWSDSDQHGKEILWRNLHRCEALADTALSTAPPPDPRDEALRLAAEAIRGVLDIGKRDMSNQKYDGYFDELSAALAAIAAVKGGE